MFYSHVIFTSHCYEYFCAGAKFYVKISLLLFPDGALPDKNITRLPLIPAKCS